MVISCFFKEYLKSENILIEDATILEEVLSLQSLAEIMYGDNQERSLILRSVSLAC